MGISMDGPKSTISFIHILRYIYMEHIDPQLSQADNNELLVFFVNNFFLRMTTGMWTRAGNYQPNSLYIFDEEHWHCMRSYSKS